MKVAFITNGSLKIGFGHAARVVILKKHFESRNIESKIIVPSIFSFKTDDDYIEVESFDEADLKTILLGFEVIIIDSVEDDYDKLSWIASMNIFIVSLTLFLFNFQKRYEHLSFFPSINKSCYQKINRGTKLYVGRKFVSFREEFKNVRHIVRNDAKNILITMGGTDPFGLTKIVLDSLIEMSEFNLTILLSNKSTDYSFIKEIIEGKKRIRLLNFENNMAELFKNHDIAIINGGLTRYETCIVGIPFLALSINHKQFDITQEFAKEGAGVNLGVYTSINKSDIAKEVQKMLSDYNNRLLISNRMKKLFDTKGSERILDIISQEFVKYEKINEKS